MLVTGFSGHISNFASVLLGGVQMTRFEKETEKKIAKKYAFLSS
jgi:hypothetical protein